LIKRCITGAVVARRLLGLFISFPGRLLSDDTVHTTFIIWYDNFRNHFGGDHHGRLVQNPNQPSVWTEGRCRCQLFTAYPHNIRGSDRFFTYISEKKDAERKTREEKLTSHGETLVKAFTDFHYQQLGCGRVSRKPIDLDWRKYLELFTYHKEFLEHLYTDDIALYDSLSHNQAKFEYDLDKLIYGVDLKARHLGGIVTIA
jgi:hypothetical protein